MLVLTNWLNKAQPEQIIALGTDLVMRGVKDQNGWTGRVEVEIGLTHSNPEQPINEWTARHVLAAEDDLKKALSQTPTNKWVA